MKKSGSKPPLPPSGDAPRAARPPARSRRRILHVSGGLFAALAAVARVALEIERRIIRST